MRKESKVIVSVRLLTGDSVDVSVKTVDTNFAEKDYTILLKKIKNKIEKYDNAKLYYTIRCKINGKKDNWKFTDIESVYNQLEYIFR